MIGIPANRIVMICSHIFYLKNFTGIIFEELRETKRDTRHSGVPRYLKTPERYRDMRERLLHNPLRVFFARVLNQSLENFP